MKSGLILAMAAFPALADTPPAQVHPDYVMEEVALPAKYKTMGIDFLPDGRMVLGVIDVVGQGEVPAANEGNKVFVLKGWGKTMDNLSMKEVCNNGFQLTGVTVAGSRVYVSDRDGFYRIDDLETPAKPAENRTLMVKWPDENKWTHGYSWHQWVFTPLYHQGRFYAPYAGSIGPGGWSYTEATTALSGAFLSWDSAGKLEAVAGGLRSPNGAGIDRETGEMFVTDNQGSWLPASTFMRIRRGHFYGHRQIAEHRNDSGRVTHRFRPNFAEDLPYDPPVAWLPYRTVRSSPSQPVVVPEGRYAGDWLIGDVNHPGLVRVYLDRVDSAINGAVFPFTQGTLSSAINRMVFGPDGGLYIGTMMRVAGNWPSMEKMGVYRMMPKPGGGALFDIRAARSVRAGLELEFTEPVDPATLAMLGDSLKAIQWQYVRKAEYGHGKQPDQVLAVAKTELSRDGKRLYLQLDGLAADRVVHVRLPALKSAAGRALWNEEVWFTLNALSSRAWDPGVGSAARPARPRAPSARLRALPGQGIVQVTLQDAGPWSLSLRGLDGSLAAARRGSGPGRLELSAGRRGVFLLQVETSRGRETHKLLL